MQDVRHLIDKQDAKKSPGPDGSSYVLSNVIFFLPETEMKHENGWGVSLTASS